MSDRLHEARHRGLQGAEIGLGRLRPLLRRGQRLVSLGVEPARLGRLLGELLALGRHRLDELFDLVELGLHQRLVLAQLREQPDRALDGAEAGVDQLADLFELRPVERDLFLAGVVDAVPETFRHLLVLRLDLGILGLDALDHIDRVAERLGGFAADRGHPFFCCLLNGQGNDAIDCRGEQVPH
jgi:hypothetical protein